MADSGSHGTALTSARLAALLAELRAVRPEILAVALSTRSGLLLGSATDGFDEAETLAALGAGLLGAAGTLSEALLGGAPAEVLVNGPAGYVIALAAGPHAVLSAVTAPTASMTLLMPDLRQAAVYFGQSVTV